MSPISTTHNQQSTILSCSYDHIFFTLPGTIISEFYPSDFVINTLAAYERDRHTPRAKERFGSINLLELLFTRLTPSNESPETAPPPLPGSKEAMLPLPPMRSSTLTDTVLDYDLSISIYHHLDFLYAFSQIPKPSVQEAYQSTLHSSIPAWLKTCCLLMWVLDNPHELEDIETLTLRAGAYKLTELSPILLKYLPNLKALTAQGHRIRELDIAFLPPDLKHLDLSHNQIKQIVSTQRHHFDPIQPCCLEQLILSHNKLFSLSDFSMFPHLKALFLEDNELVNTITFPNSHFQKLERLSLAHNQLSVLGGLMNLPSLAFLDLSHNRLRSLELDALPSLLCLDVSHNGLATVESLLLESPLPCSYLNISHNPVLISDETDHGMLLAILGCSFPDLGEDLQLEDLITPPVYMSCSTPLPINELFPQAPPLPVATPPLQYAQPRLSPIKVDQPAPIDPPPSLEIDPIPNALASIELIRLISTENPRLEDIYRRVLRKQKDPVDPVAFIEDFSETLRSNRFICLQITSISNLGRDPFQHKLTSLPSFLKLFEKLGELVLVNQALTSLEGLSSYPKLQLLNLEGNSIATLDELPNLPSLRILSLTNNKIASFEKLLNLLSLPAIETCHLEGNPIAETIDAEENMQFFQLLSLEKPSLTLHLEAQDNQEIHPSHFMNDVSIS